MDPDLYKAAAKGEIDPFNKIAKDHLGSIVTHNKNTVLHVNIASQTHKQNREGEIGLMKSHNRNQVHHVHLVTNLFQIQIHNREGESVSTKFVEQILEMCPSLLLQVNAKGDAPLHVAAKCGHRSVVKALIEFAKGLPQDLESGVESTARQMLEMTNDEKNTALHEAVQHGSLDVVKMLIKADPDVPYSANCRGETPLYMTAAKGIYFYEMVAEISENCPSAAHEGPIGKTALHAAAISYEPVRPYDDPVVRKLLEKKKSLTRERDQHGWTPLHYAAYSGNFGGTHLLLESDRSAALIANKDRKMTALHLAAGQGNESIMDAIIDHCPECCELVDDRGWNVLHFAMGNTPLHVLAALCPQSYYVVSYVVPWNTGRAYYEAVNKQNISVHHIVRHGFPDLEQEIGELTEADGSGQYPEGVVKMKKDKIEKYSFWKFVDKNVIGMTEASESHLVVAALIATVTFAAAFTLPGGYKSDIEDGRNTGTAILTKNAAFQAFAVSDAIAMVLSLSAVFVHFILSLKLFRKFICLFVFALLLTLVAMLAMVVAFITGTYAALGACLSPYSVLVSLHIVDARFWLSSFYDQGLCSINFTTTRISPRKASSPEVPAHTDRSEYAGCFPGANPPTLKSDMKVRGTLATNLMAVRLPLSPDLPQFTPVILPTFGCGFSISVVVGGCVAFVPKFSGWRAKFASRMTCSWMSRIFLPLFPCYLALTGHTYSQTSATKHLLITSGLVGVFPSNTGPPVSSVESETNQDWKLWWSTRLRLVEQILARLASGLAINRL
ncbi:ANK REP REGION domain-containing protein [Citrus sinensis]|uniref:ANK REP REGION domain-containing protein n=1 Tax=Citrus sinensis TaxID=2711 RepID=A0ACB8I662_CITSI|nr:ANK REP REGION domain-containing protein [Citrus sinensis]